MADSKVRHARFAELTCLSGDRSSSTRVRSTRGRIRCFRYYILHVTAETKQNKTKQNKPRQSQETKRVTSQLDIHLDAAKFAKRAVSSYSASCLVSNWQNERFLGILLPFWFQKN